MKIGITCYPTYGGSGVVATELGMELAARGHDVHFISYAPPIRLTDTNGHIRFHEVEISSYPLFDHAPYALSLAVKMMQVAESEGEVPRLTGREQRFAFLGHAIHSFSQSLNQGRICGWLICEM